MNEYKSKEKCLDARAMCSVVERVEISSCLCVSRALLKKKKTLLSRKDQET